MDIFGIGGGELIAILVIALVVAGPARMIRWAYLLGQFFAKLRVMWAQAAASLQKELDAAGVEVQVPKDVPTRQTLRRDINNMVNPLLREVREPLDEFNAELRRTRTEVREATNAAKTSNGAVGTGDSPAAATPNAKPSMSGFPTAVLPSSLGTWGANAGIAPADKPTEPENLGTWGQSVNSAPEPEQRAPTTPAGEA